MVHTITLFSTEDLTTFERAYNSSPIEMPSSETIGKNEYLISPEDFLEAFRNWNRDADPLLGIQDQLSGLKVWLSQPATERIRKAIKEGKETVDLL